MGEPKSKLNEGFESPPEIIVKFRPEVALPFPGVAGGAIDRSWQDFEMWLRGIGATARPCFPLLAARLRLAAGSAGPGEHPACTIERYVSVLVPPSVHEAETLLHDLSLLPGVEWVSVAPPGGPPPQTPDHTGLQGYLERQSPGVGAKDAWRRQGGAGKSVKVCVCDHGFRATHEDLPPVTLVPSQAPNQAGLVGTTAWEHGTEVLGVIAGINDQKGVTGIAHAVELMFAPVDNQNRKGTIDAAINSLGAGDVLVLEMQDTMTMPNSEVVAAPQEFDPAIREALKGAAQLGIIVVAAAGNGHSDLGIVLARKMVLGQLQMAHVWDRQSTDFDDSLAIMVGAGTQADQTRVPESNFGNRVDCQGWGDSIVTTGSSGKAPLDLRDSNNDYPLPNATYNKGFGATSGATAMIAGVVACLQGVTKGAALPPLTSTQCREVVSDKTFGTRQPEPDATNYPIGPLPNLANLEGRMIEFQIPLGGPNIPGH